MSRGRGSTVQLRRLGDELRRLREAAELTRDQVSEQLDLAMTTLYRIETGRARPQSRTLRALLDLYGVTDQRQRDALVELTRQAGQPTWWQAYGDVLPDPYATLIGLEAGASFIRALELVVIPGLLQTEDYIRALVRGELKEASTEEIERRVEVRIARQQRLIKDEAPLRLWTIIDEAALHRHIGGREVMAGQIQRLAEAAADLPKVTIQVVPFAAGAHSGLPGSFTILEFPDPSDRDVVYVESIAGDLYVDKPEDVGVYVEAFDHLRATALSPEDTRAKLEAVAATLR